MKSCSMKPLTGFYRNGKCDTGFQDTGVHTVCAKVTKEFLEFSVAQGNDLVTPMPAFNFSGLKPGDCWCLCAARWKEAYDAGSAPLVRLEATHEGTFHLSFRRAVTTAGDCRDVDGIAVWLFSRRAGAAGSGRRLSDLEERSDDDNDRQLGRPLRREQQRALVSKDRNDRVGLFGSGTHEGWCIDAPGSSDRADRTYPGYVIRIWYRTTTGKGDRWLALSNHAGKADTTGTFCLWWRHDAHP